MHRSNKDSRTQIPVNVIGAGRGARRMQPHVARFNEASRTLRLDPLFIDVAPGKAEELARKGREFGVRASAEESTGEAFLASQDRDSEFPVVVAIDDREAISRILRMDTSSPLFIYNITDLPRLGLAGWRFILKPEDRDLRERVSEFFRNLAEVTAPSGAREVFGPASRARNSMVEGRYRAWFGDHFQRNVRKVVHGLEPETSPFEVTFDGHNVSQVEVMEKKKRWRTREELFSDLEGSLRVPVRRGTNFVVTELGSESIRLHKIRLRLTDGRFELTGRSWSEAAPESRAGMEQVASVLSKLSAALLSD